MGDFAENGFLKHIETHLHFHVGDVDVAVAFVSSFVDVVTLRLRKLGDGCVRYEQADTQKNSF